jgi:oxalate decarboxylase/phosphoglucose isomerase-like protein (cupin superfamily)
MVNRPNVYDCSLIDLGKVHNLVGNITVAENLQQIPFEVKRVYYLYDVPGGESRGGHAHKELNQLIVAASGSFDLTVDDGRTKRTFHLARPNFGVYMPAGLWRDISNFSSGSICLVLASHVYDEDDYLRDYDYFLKYKNELNAF